MSRITKNLLLVGSLPFDTVEKVFRTMGPRLSAHLPSIPDGEVGDRLYWTCFQCYRVLHGHPDVETVQRPDRINGVENWRPSGYRDQWIFRVRPGAKEVRFGDPGWRLGYAKEALNSYFVFKTLRKEGFIAPHVRFQVCIPLTGSIIEHYFRDPDDYPKIKPGYEQALRDEIAMMTKKIPPEDLVIQWDACSEVLDLEGFYDWTPKDDKFERLISPCERLTPSIPDDVLVGYHFCYGTLGGWPIVKQNDLALCVKLANAAVERSGRRVDYVHMPVQPDRFDDAFYAPLSGLKVGDTKVFLGLIHHQDVPEGFSKRMAAARRRLPDFGLASVCGYGRRPPSELDAIIDSHAAAIEALAQYHHG